MDLFQNKYRILSARAQWWNYGNSGRYFITICTQNRKHFFGEIKNKIMYLSEIGQLANRYWMEIRHHFLFVILDEFIVMPNHIHGILILTGNDNGDGVADVETRHSLSLPIPTPIQNPPVKNDFVIPAKARYHPLSGPTNPLFLKNPI